MRAFSRLRKMGIPMEDGLFSLVKIEEAELPEEAAEEEEPGIREEDYVTAEEHICPVCKGKFKYLSVKQDMIKVVRMNPDLRPVYEPVDSLKYSVIMCPECGYASRKPVFDRIDEGQAAVLKEKLAFQYKSRKTEPAFYSYEEAALRYQMALTGLIDIGAPDSEKAYLCLMMAWLYRSQRMYLAKAGHSPEKAKIEMMECMKKEAGLIQHSLDGFKKALQKEAFPVCGMDRNTVIYLVAALLYDIKDYDQALHMLARLLSAEDVGENVRKRAMNLRDLIAREAGKGR